MHGSTRRSGYPSPPSRSRAAAAGAGGVDSTVRQISTPSLPPPTPPGVGAVRCPTGTPDGALTRASWPRQSAADIRRARRSGPIGFSRRQRRAGVCLPSLAHGAGVPRLQRQPALPCGPRLRAGGHDLVLSHLCRWPAEDMNSKPLAARAPHQETRQAAAM